MGSVVFLVVVAAVAVLVWGVIRWQRRVDTVWHDTYCTCARCRERCIRTAVQRHEWSRQQREIEAAVQEMLKSERDR